jgi:hypothetical protein
VVLAPARGAQRSSFATRQRELARARARVVHTVLWHDSSCPRRARLPLDVPFYPPPPPVYSMRSDHVVYINETETQLKN